MGKYDLAIRLGKSLLSDTASYVKACGKRSILETKPTIFHGINPTAIYPLSGKTFALPRFCTLEMQEARRMNKIAVRQAKSQGIDRTYPNATPQDLKRLTSETIEDSYSRVEWTNPKDGKVYNLLKQGETKDGKVVVRILDEHGAFVKEANITPKIHVLIDDTAPGVFAEQYKNSYDSYITEFLKMSHFDLIQMGAKRANPFEKTILYDVRTSCIDGKYDVDKRGIEIYKEIIKDIDNKKMSPYIISMSRGVDYKFSESLSEFSLQEHKSFKNFVSELQKSGIRILVSAGNSGKNSQSIELLNTGAEGVGALQHGKIASYSASRNSKFTQHYEESALNTTVDELGNVNITGIPGTDFSLKNNFLLGRTQKDYEIQISELLNYRRLLSKRVLKLKKEGKLIQEMIDNYKHKCELIDNIYAKLQSQRRNVSIKNGVFVPIKMRFDGHGGTSLATAIRAAKLALNDMMKDVL